MLSKSNIAALLQIGANLIKHKNKGLKKSNHQVCRDYSNEIDAKPICDHLNVKTHCSFEMLKICLNKNPRAAAHARESWMPPKKQIKHTSLQRNAHQ